MYQLSFIKKVEWRKSDKKDWLKKAKHPLPRNFESPNVSLSTTVPSNVDTLIYVHGGNQRSSNLAKYRRLRACTRPGICTYTRLVWSSLARRCRVRALRSIQPRNCRSVLPRESTKRVYYTHRLLHRVQTEAAPSPPGREPTGRTTERTSDCTRIDGTGTRISAVQHRIRVRALNIYDCYSIALAFYPTLHRVSAIRGSRKYIAGDSTRARAVYAIAAAGGCEQPTGSQTRWYVCMHSLVPPLPACSRIFEIERTNSPKICTEYFCPSEPFFIFPVLSIFFHFCLLTEEAMLSQKNNWDFNVSILKIV